MSAIRAHAYPRAGVLGNPSDGYGGRVLALTFSDFQADVELRDEGLSVEELLARFESGGSRGIEQLTDAALSRFNKSYPLPSSTKIDLTARTNIPRQVGMSGSSALIIATLKALAERANISVAPRELALLAWEAETLELGIAAGPQDRVAQAHGGLLDMDFSAPWSAESFRHNDPAMLPPLLIAWNPAPGDPSGDVHDTVRERYENGEAAVVEAMSQFPRFTADGISALERGDLASFLGCMNANFDTRAMIWDLRDKDLELISIGREAGCATKFTGSGGAILCASPDLPTLERAEEAYASRALPTLRPTPAPSVTEITT